MPFVSGDPVVPMPRTRPVKEGTMTSRFVPWPIPVIVSILAACGSGDEETKEPVAPSCTGADTGRFCVTPVGEGGDQRSPDGSSCNALVGVVRDFRRGDREGGHPDFEMFWGDGEFGLVEPALGPEGKPTLAVAEPQTVHSRESFAQWYEDVDGVNETFGLTLELETGETELRFGSTEFFPVDDLGFGNEGMYHNYGFTTELHATFRYDGRPDAAFTFIGDDDLWVYINGRLAIDLGGVHAPMTATFLLAEHAAELDLVEGEEYPIDLFHAERRATMSSFVVHTNLEFLRCGG